jgi:hypothetical protein
MRTKQTLLAAAILGVSVAAAAETAIPAPVHPLVPAYPVAPVALDADQLKAAAEQYGRYLRAAFEQASQAWAVAIEQQRKQAEEFQRFHDDSIKAASVADTVSLDEIRKQGEALREETARMSEEVRERVLSADRTATRAYFDAKAAEMDARFADAERQMAASRKATDERFATALNNPLTPGALPRLPGQPF